MARAMDPLVDRLFLPLFLRFGVLSLFFSLLLLLTNVNGQTVVTQVTQAPRPSLESLVKVDDMDECILLDNAYQGRTNGLEGIVCQDSESGLGSNIGGYVRWHVVFRRIDGLAFPRDEQLRLRFLAVSTGYEPEVIHEIELRQGDVESRSSFLAPDYARGNSSLRQVYCRVYSDGRELKGLSATEFGNRNFNAQQKSDPQAKFGPIVIGSKRALNEIDSLTTEEREQLEALESKVRWLLPRSSLALLENFPTDWREIAAKPSYAIDVDELSRLAPEQALALQQFVAAGGQLIIAGSQSGFGTGGELDSDVKAWLEQFFPSTVRSREGWQNVVDPSSNARVRFLSVGFGRIAICKDGIDRMANRQVVKPIFNVVPRLDQLFDTEMMNWMIPKLGQPPVIMFCLSIGAFAFLAGPALLWWTNVKIRRPIWLLVFFPLFAVLITGSIFFYALVHDGFGTSARIRSMTWIDAESGFGCAYSRQTYFSGFPSSTAPFKNTSEVWHVRSPNENRRRSYTQDPQSEVKLQFVGGQQVFRGMLTAREQKQWMVTTPVQGLKPFKWTRSAEDPLPSVRNLMSEAWILGIFVDQDKKLFIAERALSESENELQPISLEAARDKLNERIAKPAYPVGYSVSGSQGLFDWFSFRSQYRNPNMKNNSGAPQSIEHVMDDWPINELTKPNRFLILLERGDHLDRPFKTNVTESDSSHILMGTW